LGALFPFLSILSSPDSFLQNQLIINLLNLFPENLTKNTLIFTSAIFISAIFLTTILRLFLLYFGTKLSFAAGADLGLEMYMRTLYQPYSEHVQKNSSEIINGVVIKANVVIYGVLLPAIISLSSALILIAITSAFIAIDPIIAIGSLSFLGLTYFILAYNVRNKLLADSKRIAKETTSLIKIIQEGLGSIRDILIDGTQAIYSNLYKQTDLTLRKSQSRNLIISQFPRHVIEGVAMIFLVSAAILFADNGGDLKNTLPTLGIIGLAFQRILPTLQQGFGAWASIQGTRASFEDALALLAQPLPEYPADKKNEKIKFNKKIELEDISFTYHNGEHLVLKDINLSIHRGDKIGIVGESGSGKSTLVDIIMGLLQPTAGTLTVDDIKIDLNNCKSWQLQIAHVPQSIFLIDGSLEENIAFGIPRDEINLMAVRRSAKQAKILDLIDSSSDTEVVKVGERGVRLSGGQRQRVGIARALYKNAQILIFDEATSALDIETEKNIMDSIDGLSEDLTLIIIAHRLDILSRCSKIVEVSNGAIKSVSTYKEFIKTVNERLKQ